METIYTTVFLFLSIVAFAQPQIELETTEFDFGRIVTSGRVKKAFKIKNIGNEPLIITRVRTGDGGSFATYPKYPVLPDSIDEIVFHYNSKRIGPFRKLIVIQSNAQDSYGKSIRIKGEVIHKITQIEIQEDTIDIGEIPFGTIGKAICKVKNIGEEKLYLQAITSKYYESDLFYQKIEPNKNRLPYESKEQATITIALRNIYGNVGSFQRKFLLKYNSLDTVSIIIKGKYVGKAIQEKRYEEKSIYQYLDNQLMTKTEVNYNGDIRKVSHFKGAYCTHIQYFDYVTGQVNIERFFELGELIEEKRYE